MTGDDKDKDGVMGFCVIELMGHRKLTGFVRAVEVAGSPFLRIDVPGPATKDETGPWQATQFYSPAAVYCITPTTAALAIRAAGINAPAPVTRWDLPAEKPARVEAPSLPWREDIDRPDRDDPDADDSGILDRAG